MVLHECTNEIVQARLTALPMTEPAAAAAPTSLPLPGIKPGVVRQIHRFRIVCDFKLHSSLACLQIKLQLNKV